MIFTGNDISKLGTILGVWAHPDDESRCLAGVMAVAAGNGQRVVCITATHGEGGQTADEKKWPRAELGKIRSQELNEALKVIGVKEHYWLHYEDGYLASCDPNKAAEEIATLIQKIKPDTIFCFGPDGLTGHPDHCTVYEWTKMAIHRSQSKAAFYRVVEPAEKFNAKITHDCNELFHLYVGPTATDTATCEDSDLYFVLPDDIKQKKLTAIQKHQSQYAQMFANPVGVKYFTEIDGSECFMKVIT